MSTSTPPKKKAPLPEATTPKHNRNSSDSTQPSAVQHSWRDFYEPHPAALVFHRGTTNEDRQKMSEDLKENQRLQARFVTAHVADESGGKTYVVDGITRLDEMEKLGWQIVDEHGNWIGQAAGMFDHRRNYRHEQVRQLVISLNATRRHQTKQQIVESIDAVLKVEEASKGISDKRLSEIQPRKVGRPKDHHKAELTKRAAEVGISEHTVKKALAKQADRPTITKPAKRKPNRPPMPLEDRVWPKWSKWLKQWTATNEVEDVKTIIFGWLKAKKA